MSENAGDNPMAEAEPNKIIIPKWCFKNYYYLLVNANASFHSSYWDMRDSHIICITGQSNYINKTECEWCCKFDDIVYKLLWSGC